MKIFLIILFLFGILLSCQDCKLCLTTITEEQVGLNHIDTGIKISEYCSRKEWRKAEKKMMDSTYTYNGRLIRRKSHTNCY